MRASTSAAVVVVTGASSGIGRAAAVQVAARHDHVVLLARREDKLEEVAAECREAGAVGVTVLATDVSDDAAVAEAVGRVVADLGRVDTVLHCAGIVTYGRTEEVSAEDFESVVRTNLLGAVNVARHVIPVMREQGEGALVIVGSLLGQIAVPDMTPYVVSKWGVRALARQLRIENLDVPGIRVVHVAPGSVDTDIYGKALDSAGAVNSAPPPTISPERAARVVVARAEHGRAESQTAYSNYALLLAFRTVPLVWDRVVGPAFRLVSRRG